MTLDQRKAYLDIKKSRMYDRGIDSEIVFGSTRLLGHDSPLFHLLVVVAYHSTKQTLHYVESVTLDVYDWYFISAPLSSIIQRA